MPEKRRAIARPDEHGNLPPDVLAAWLAAQGLITVDDPDQAATHFTLLTFSGAADQSFHGAVPLSDAALRTTVTTGVRAFLRRYPRP
ncbi:TetR/AcrR family transcriptional regulator C-terminal domain-containing protein [Kitasatospora sp. NPDC008115]|uniref:TetR/AcrR family transcriptional regulator C-terminal domain-containing protein n=1 Tax=Kitasatospora sp. NPDC008115 TaxID=3364022 RepID=UPI0036EAC51B